MREIVEQKFIEVFAKQPTIISRAPGRLEVLGNHTDYNGGLVLSLAIDRETWVALAPRDDRMVEVYDIRLQETESFSLDELEPFASGSWITYVKGVCSVLKAHGISIQGFDAVLMSSIPLSAGMSSSAALEESFILALRALADADNIGSHLENARIGQEVENKVIGAQTGLMDQMTSLSGIEHGLLSSNFKALSFSHVPFPARLACVVANSGVKHDHTKDYNARREDCMRALEGCKAAGFAIDCLSDMNSEDLKSLKDKLDPLAYKRAMHVVGENERVVAASQALEVHDYEVFGGLLGISHKSSQLYFENSCPELDELVALGSELDGFVGARVSGGGFGGISLHVVLAEKAEAYAEKLNECALREHGIKPQAIVCKSANGASIVYDARR